MATRVVGSVDGRTPGRARLGVPGRNAHQPRCNLAPDTLRKRTVAFRQEARELLAGFFLSTRDHEHGMRSVSPPG